MSNTFKIEKARALHSRKVKRDGKGNFVKEIIKPHKKVKLIDPPIRISLGRISSRNYIDDGGVRYGNQRKAMAEAKIKERRAERKRNNLVLD